MQYLTIDEIKKQVVVDQDYHEDDEFFEMIGDAAEDLVLQLTNWPNYGDIEATFGELPATLRHAMRICCDYFYSQQRGSSGEANDIPDAVYLMTKLYKNYN